MTPAAILFDFDGVVVDSFEMHKTAWIRAFQEVTQRPFPTMNPEELTGKSSRTIATMICEQGGVPEQIDEIFMVKTKLIVDGTLSPTLLNGAIEALAFCNFENIPYAIASNAPRDYIVSVLKQNKIELPLVLGFEEVENPKPAPDLFELAAEKLGVDSLGEIVVFEDSVPGLIAAKSANMKPIGIRGKFEDQLMRNAGATLIFSSLQEALENKNAIFSSLQ